MKITEAIEMLQCAEINCENIKKGGIIFVDIAKDQIRQAIMLLEDSPND